MNVDLTLACQRSVGKRVAANSSMMVGSKILAATLGIITLTVTAKALDSTLSFGTIMFLHAYMLFFSEVATFQAWQGIIRFGTDDIKNENAPSLAKLLKFSMVLDFLSAIAAYLGAIGLFSLFIWLGQQFPSLTRDTAFSAQDLQKYVNIYCLAILFRQLGTSIGVFRLFDKFKVLAVKALIMPTTRLSGAIFAAYAGWGINGFLAVWFMASVVSYIFLPTAAMLELKRRGLLKMVLKAPADLTAQRPGLWSFTLKSNIDSTLAAGHLHLPLLLVTAIFGPAFAGIYKIAEEAAKLLSEGFKLFDQVIYPELAKMITSGDGSKIWKMVTRTAAILLSFGLAFSLILVLLGPKALSSVLGADYAFAAPLASLLVPAAALLGVIAPLYPIFYATGRPENAIYARALSLIVYVIALFLLSSVIGKMAAAWAMIFGNIFAVIFVVITAKRSLNSAVKTSSDMMTSAIDSNTPTVSILGLENDDNTTKLWGLSLLEWQKRAFKKIGCGIAPDDAGHLHIDGNYVLSSELMKSLIKAENTALVSDGVIVAVSGNIEAKALLGSKAADALVNISGISFKAPHELAGSYNKTLRKTETPYAIDTRIAAISDILKRQFASSYKGITDFVTKYFWPKPAYYVTRACAAAKLTPNMVTTIGLILCIAATYYFYHGQWALGFITGWLMTFLDTVDGKLARTTMSYSSWGNIYDHGIDLIHPPFWYYAWFIGLEGLFSTDDTLSIALIAILIGYVVDRVIEGIFIAQHGFHIHVWRQFNSFLRIYTARRNPNTFIFMIGVVLSIWITGAAQYGFYAVAIWTWVCILINIIVVLGSNLTRKPVVSWMDS